MEEQEKQAVKQTSADLYLMVPKNSKTGVRVTLLSVKKIKSFAEVAPTKEILATHFQAEHVRMEIADAEAKKAGKNAKYLPQPLYLQIQSSIFATIVEEARGKDKDVDGKALCLTLGSQIPCCVITPMPEAPVEDEQPKQVRKKRTPKIVINND